MHVLLVRPKSLSMISNVDVINLEPLELEYLYTIALEEKVKCQILDCLLDKRSLIDVLKEFTPDLVVIGGYITQEAIMLDYSKTVKVYNASIKVMIGGVHAQVNYERFYTDTIDYIVHSSSLEPFRKILRLGTVLQNTGLKAIDGICYREDKTWIMNKSLPINPDDLPIPDRSHFNANKHLYRYLGFSPCAIVKTAFSCPYQCNFCFCRKINDGQYAARNIDLVVEEIAGIACDTIHIVDDTFLINRERVNRFIALIKEKNIKKSFIFYSRADFVVENEAIIKALGAIGTKGIIVGLEAVDDGALNAYGKQSSQDLNKQCVKMLQKYHIECLALFIVDIHATKMDFDNLYQWIEKVELKYASVSIFTPIPGTALFDQYKDKLTTEKMQYWDFLHLVLEPTNMSRKSFYLVYYKLFLKLSLLGKKNGVYDFVDMQYIRNTAKIFFRNLIKGL
ncbi:B12-binding domain-containing radical SAM protein [Cellulosilyticum sp. I15G10I2]|uniref:B12-binding domain-containing radical SAM protein n=1 Tax=Cellulosilyticum sp. I15G10I2 TaxID=1892843 RepID=UPI00085C7E80|nr:radical SAM protein [Cellulosilyticum sp. I15G10I2]